MAILGALTFLSSCTMSQDRPAFMPAQPTDRPYTIRGKRYYPQRTYTLHSEGLASYYGKSFHGKPTASGEAFSIHKLTGAHRSLQIPCVVRVTNCQNGRCVILRINDRGPFHSKRILDVSYEAARQLGFLRQGVAKVRLQVLKTPSLKAEKCFVEKRQKRVALRYKRLTKEGKRRHFRAKIHFPS